LFRVAFGPLASPPKKRPQSFLVKPSAALKDASFPPAVRQSSVTI
jgi:hypothetical protein